MPINQTMTNAPDMPRRSDPVNFDDRADAGMEWMEGLSAELNQFAAELNATQDEINTSEQNTAESASAAGSSATLAAEKAGEAVAAAHSAATSASTATAAYNQVIARYLGESETAPTEGPGGEPLAEGMQYFHTGTAPGMRVYWQGAWAITFSPATGAMIGANNLSDVADEEVARNNLGITALLAGKASTVHAHDDLYYRKGDIDTRLAGKASTVHAHDDLYYRKGDIDTQLAGKASTGHGHTPQAIGAAPAEHGHDYLPLAGGELTGPVTLPNGVQVAGSGAGFEVSQDDESVTVGVDDTYARYSSSTGAHYFYGSVTAQGNITAYSDQRVKTNIRVIDGALDKVLRLRGVTFDRTDMKCPRQAGVIAQEVNEVLPEVVQKAPTTGHLYVAYGNLIGLLIEAIKEQQCQIDALKGGE